MSFMSLQEHVPLWEHLIKFYFTKNILAKILLKYICILKNVRKIKKKKKGFKKLCIKVKKQKTSL